MKILDENLRYVSYSFLLKYSDGVLMSSQNVEAVLTNTQNLWYGQKKTKRVKMKTNIIEQSMTISYI